MIKKEVDNKISFTIFMIIALFLFFIFITPEYNFSLSTDQAYGIVQGIAYDRNLLPMSNAVINIEKKTKMTNL